MQNIQQPVHSQNIKSLRKTRGLTPQEKIIIKELSRAFAYYRNILSEEEKIMFL